MTGDHEARSWQALVELNKQVDDQEQRGDAALEMDVQRNPFDRRDFLLFMIPIVIIVLAMWEGCAMVSTSPAIQA
jgi:hypothetical protein